MERCLTCGKKLPDPAAEAAQRHKDAASRRQEENTKALQEIGPLPPVKDPVRKESCRFNFPLFLETYCKRQQWKPWSDDHRKGFEEMERIILGGGKKARAWPRAYAKTTIAELAAIWAMLYGHHEFVAILGKNRSSADETIDSIKTELEDNELLYEDFPEVIHPIRCLEGEGRKAPGQLLDGEKTRLTWGKSKIVFPTVKGSKVSGHIFRACGLGSTEVRGMKKKRRGDLESLRPTLILIDDPQDEKSSVSPLQTHRLERTIMGGVMGMRKLGGVFSVFLLVTCQQNDDLAEKMLARSDWEGERVSMVLTFPTNQKLWDEYRAIKEEGERKGLKLKPATDFYIANRAAMDEGCTLSWPDMPYSEKEGEVSAIQSAMNFLISDEVAFWSERQNQPKPPAKAGDLIQLDKAQLAERLNQHERRLLPKWAELVTFGIDCQGLLLYYCVCAWATGFKGQIVDYGVWPDQARTYFSLKDAAPSVYDVTKTRDEESALYAALGHLCNRLLQPWQVDQGGTMQVGRGLIDSGWKASAVERFAREYRMGALLQPSKGHGVTAKQAPMDEWPRKDGERRGPAWLKKSARGVLVFDSNTWKSNIAERLLVPMGERSALTLFGKEARQHALFLDHLTSESRTETEGRGRRLEEWTLKPARENHWFDSLVMCAVAASERGIAVMGAEKGQGLLTFGHLTGQKKRRGSFR